MNSMSPCHTKLRHALIHKLGLAYGPGIEDCEISEAVGELINERDALRESHSMISALLHIVSTKPSDIMKAVDTLRRERGELQCTINGLKHLVELPESAGLTELFNAVEALELNKSERGTLREAYDSNVRDLRNQVERLELTCENQRELLARPDTTQPQLSEIRYVLHGDIQPCSVLYSDDTTTLLRLDEGDIMCETDTIEWSDSVTYRCQELLRAVASGTGRHVSLPTVELMGMLVRDNRILINDGGELSADTDDAYEQYLKGSSSPMTRKGWEQAARPTSPGREWTDNNSPTLLR